MAAGAPQSISSNTPSGCVALARVAETIGLQRRSMPISSSLAPTCAGPSSAPASTTVAALAPARVSMPGKCAAIAAEVKPATAKT